jgi:hypothetical protein
VLKCVCVCVNVYVCVSNLDTHNARACTHPPTPHHSLSAHSPGLTFSSDVARPVAMLVDGEEGLSIYESNVCGIQVSSKALARP